jgi:hypothetical protein
MDFERGAHYLITMNHRRFPTEPFEAVYAGSFDSLATMYHNFVVVDEAFVIGVPEDQIGFDFNIEPLPLGDRNSPAV